MPTPAPRAAVGGCCGAAGGSCGWGDFATLVLRGGVQQWLAGLEARCLFDLRWRGNGTGAVVAVGGGWVAALWRWRSWDFFVFVWRL